MFCNTPDYTYLNSGGVPLKKETHGGDDVGIWAKGRQDDVCEYTGYSLNIVFF